MEEWEKIGKAQEAFSTGSSTHKMKVPSGWIYRHQFVIGSTMGQHSSNPVISESMCFVPDAPEV